MRRLIPVYVFLSMVTLLTSCGKSEDLASNATPSNNHSASEVPAIQIKMQEINTVVDVQLPFIDQADACAAAHNSEGLCVMIRLDNSEIVNLSGSITVNQDPSGSNICATGSVSGSTENPFDATDIAKVDVYLQSETGDCNDIESVVNGGSTLGYTQPINTYINEDDDTVFELRLTLDGVSNEFVDPIADRSFHTATMLGDGRVLIAGGLDSSGSAVGSIIVFDANTNTFSPGPTMLQPRFAHTATRFQYDSKEYIAFVGGESTNVGDATLIEFLSVECLDNTITCSSTSATSPFGEPPGVSHFLPQNRVDLQVVYGSVQQALLISGGRTFDGSTWTMVPIEDSILVLDFLQNSLIALSAPGGSSESGPPPSSGSNFGEHTSHVAYSTPVPGLGDAFVINLGVSDLAWEITSYRPSALGVISDCSGGPCTWIIRDFTAVLSSTQTRVNAQAMEVAPGVFSILGGSQFVSDNPTPGFTLFDNAWNWSIDPNGMSGIEDRFEDPGVQLAVARERFEATPLFDVASKPLNRRFLLSGGGELDVITPFATTASKSLEVLLSFNDATTMCVAPIMQPVVIGDTQLQMVRSRQGHTTSFLDSGSVLVFGGRNGTISQSGAFAYTYSNNVKSYEIIANPILPIACPQ